MRTLYTALARVIPLLLLTALPAVAQDPSKPATADTAPTPPAPAPAPALPFSFSGVIYSNYQYGGLKGSRAQNRFDLDRAYLNFRSSAGEHDSIRVTLDVYQQRDTVTSAYYRGWAMRVKYAYGQYDYIRGVGNELHANVRLGLLQTVIVDREEQVWNRGLSQVAVEQTGFFASSDAGIATTIALPNHRGEIYADIVNGSGYSSRELDRFKDFQARLTLTPLANTFGYLKGFQISPWISKGLRASDFAKKHGTVLPVSEGLQKDRYGLFVAIRDPRLTLGAQLARRIDVGEAADTTVAVAPTATTFHGDLTSAYAILHPFTFFTSAPEWPIALTFRADRFKPNAAKDPYQHFYIAGISWELNKKTSVTFDYQTQEPKLGSGAQDTKTYFLHIITNF